MASKHPPVPVTVYVIVTVPDAILVITPVELIVATEVSDDDHEPPVWVEENVVVPFEHIA